jgi:two-component system, response regulator PdtaR
LISATPKILLVDDDPLILATLCSVLGARGFNPIAVSEPERALAMIGSCRPDMLVLDYDMPRVSGLQIARSISDAFDPPFMFLSAYNDESIYKDAVALGAVGYIVKPVDPETMPPAIWAGLQTAANVRKLRQQATDLVATLGASRDVSVATGLLMERLRVSREIAYEGLRRYARNRQQTIKDVSAEILESTATLNRTLTEITSSLVRRDQ